MKSKRQKQLEQLDGYGNLLVIVGSKKDKFNFKFKDT